MHNTTLLKKVFTFI